MEEFFKLFDLLKNIGDGLYDLNVIATCEQDLGALFRLPKHRNTDGLDKKLIVAVGWVKCDEHLPVD